MNTFFTPALTNKKKSFQGGIPCPQKYVRHILNYVRHISKYLPCIFFLLPAVTANAQIVEPVKFSVSTERVSKDEIKVTFTGKIDEGWHVYSSDIPQNGPTPATFNIVDAVNVEPAGKLVPGKGAVHKYDEMFEMELSFFEKECRFTQTLKITGKEFRAKGYLEYGACSDENCLPPSEAAYELQGSDGPGAAEVKPSSSPMKKAPADSVTAAPDTAVAPAVDTAGNSNASWWTPQVEELAKLSNSGGAEQHTLLAIFLLGMLGGFVALLMPCIWPIIPMTVGFFLHRGGSRRKNIGEAITYGVAIIVIFLVLALAVTAIYGANKMNELSTNAVFNIFFFLLLLMFAASFLGGFELNLPSSWTNAVNRKSENTSGVLSIFLMAFTLVLVSFSCTCPIVGLLLVEVASTGSILAPAVGMFGFALALALPFALFAMFPAWLKQMPKSGSWMNVVKVTLGFVELAFALKFLSVADLAYGWHILDRETFLALWIAIALVLALYLFGLVHLHGEKTESVSVPRVFLGLGSLAFAIYMIPGLWGAPLRAVSAFAPPMATQDFRLGDFETHAPFTDYESGMREAERLGKPVLIDFTGYGCVNCRKMEASVWIDPKISKLLNEDYVLISLYVDDKTRLPEPEEVTIDGKKRTLRTVGDKWSYLQQVKFGANAQPFYVALDNEGRPLTGSYAYDESVPHFEKFLKDGLENYSKR